MNSKLTFEHVNPRDPAKFYEVQTFNEDRRIILYEFKNDEDYSNKIIFFNGVLGKIKAHNSRYIHFEPYERTYDKIINTSTIYYNDNEERIYYKFSKTNEPLKKILYTKFRNSIFIFEPDEELFDKTFITTKSRGDGQHLKLLLNDDDMIKDQFRTTLKYHISNIMSAIHFSTTLNGELKGYSYLEVIRNQKTKFKEAFELSTVEKIKKHVPFIYPLGSAYDKEYIDKIIDVIDELKPHQKTKLDERKEFIRQNNERYERRKQEEEARQEEQHKIIVSFDV